MTTRGDLYFWSILLLVCGIYGCERPGTGNDLHTKDASGDYRGDRKDIHSLPPPAQTYRLWHTYDQFDLRSFEFYGGFFEDKLKFFYAKDPGLRIAESEVSLIMLYFLDNRLVKIRYHLDQDVTDPILDSLGIGVLETKYNRRKMVMATGKTLKRLKEYNREKGNQDEYNIVWDRQIIESSYHVDPNPSSLYKFDTIQSHFVYVDQLKSYRKSLIALENELRNKWVLSAEK